MEVLKQHKEEAFEQAIDSLARYKFIWSAIWVHLNQIDETKEPNPFKSLVESARNIQRKNQGQSELNIEG